MDKVWWGNERVRPDEKNHHVRTLFDSVARRYDLMNDLLGGGVHRLWAGALIDWLAPRPGTCLLDVAGGTGDIAFRFLERVGGNGAAIVCDINEKMLCTGRSRSDERNVSSCIEWLCGNAEALPVKDALVDVYTIAYGLRNVNYISTSLSEARRVLKPGGRFLCLDFSHVVSPILSVPYDFYSHEILPRAARILDVHGASYLVESIRRFPDQETLSQAISDAGLEQVKYRNLFGGIAAIHSAWRI